MSKELIERIKRHEGFSRHAYACPAGYLTIGYGLNIEPSGYGLDEDLAEQALCRVLLDVEGRLMDMPWFESLDLVRGGVVLEMAYQMGVSGMLGFRKMIEAIERKDWETAAVEMLDSRWHQQTPGRAKSLARIMRTGES